MEGTDNDPNEVVGRWASDARIESAARSRSETSLRQYAALQASSLAGIACVAASSGVEVGLQTSRHGGPLRTVIKGVGADYIDTQLQSGVRALVALSAISSIEVDAQWTSLVADDATTNSNEATLASVLDKMSENRPALSVYDFGSASPKSGELIAVGEDIAVLSPAGQPNATTAMPLRAIAEVHFFQG